MTQLFEHQLEARNIVAGLGLKSVRGRSKQIQPPIGGWIINS